MSNEDKCPPHLDEHGQALWRDAANAMNFGDLPLSQLAISIRGQLRLQSEVERLSRELACREATIRMACDRLGGLVEGRPTAPLNFLQRIDELVRMEATLAAR